MSDEDAALLCDGHLRTSRAGRDHAKRKICEATHNRARLVHEKSGRSGFTRSFLPGQSWFQFEPYHPVCVLILDLAQICVEQVQISAELGVELSSASRVSSTIGSSTISTFHQFRMSID